MEKKSTTTTTIKMNEKMYEDFKIMGIKTKVNLHELVHRSMMLYLTDSEYRYKIHQNYDTYYTGSDLLNSIGK
jgi:hypothetical protein